MTSPRAHLGTPPVPRWAPAVVAVGAGLGCAAVWVGDPSTPGGVLPVCPTRALLGIDCPLCGGLRAVWWLLHGDLAPALHANALAVVGLVLGSTALALWGVRSARGVPVPPWLHPVRWHRPVLAVLAVWFVVRVLPFAPFSVLHV